MAAFLLTIKRIQSGTQLSTGIPDNLITEAEMNQALARNPDHVQVKMNVATEAQLRGMVQYAMLANGGVDTSSVETALSALV